MLVLFLALVKFRYVLTSVNSSFELAKREATLEIVRSSLFLSFATIKLMDDLYVMTAKIVKTTNIKKELAKAHLIVKEGPLSSLFSDFFGFITSASRTLFHGLSGYSFLLLEHQFYCEGNECTHLQRLFQLLFHIPILYLVKRHVLILH